MISILFAHESVIPVFSKKCCQKKCLRLTIKCVIIHADLNRKGRDHLDAGKGPRVSGGKKFSPLSFEVHMENNVLSIFVDESGRFQYPDKDSRFYILSMVFHDQSVDVRPLIQTYDESLEYIGIDSEAFVFHAGPLIRKEKGYEYFRRNLRGKIYSRMMAFARKVDFKYHCLSVDKKYIGSSLQIATRLRDQLDAFIATHREMLSALGSVKVYYDCGQTPVTNLLRGSFADIGCPVEFAQGVHPRNYKLFQIADLICSLNLVKLKLEAGDRLTESEHKFFGGASAFRRNELKFLASKRIY